MHTVLQLVGLVSGCLECYVMLILVGCAMVIGLAINSSQVIGYKDTNSHTCTVYNMATSTTTATLIGRTSDFDRHLEAWLLHRQISVWPGGRVSRRHSSVT